MFRSVSRQIPLLRSAVRSRVPSAFTLLSSRSYRGEAGEEVATLSASEEELLKVAKPKSEDIMAKHIAMPDLQKIPPSSFGSSEIDDDDLNLDIRRKRLIYRSKQRGWLEVDLLLGTWASEHVMNLDNDELDQFEAFVNMETIDIYNVITLRLDVPEEMKTSDGNGVVERIQEWARSSPLGKADPEKYKTVKTDAKLI